MLLRFNKSTTPSRLQYELPQSHWESPLDQFVTRYSLISPLMQLSMIFDATCLWPCVPRCANQGKSQPNHDTQCQWLKISYRNLWNLITCGSAVVGHYAEILWLKISIFTVLSACVFHSYCVIDRGHWLIAISTIAATPSIDYQRWLLPDLARGVKGLFS
jgi:hypothetical protein